ncbi:hypothetical protein HU200_044205 [Digitaria exilis]|uniref:Protein kinase domain-containing protein n=1 Tax=Digitaria exilis TaxID=1010633 RepID=A0A835EBD7_9POAL|nr:hypothetical protein HU200_044205 [Digitaria exilis]
MDTILQVKHQNLVPLLGYCLVGDERLLIYARVRNGSLDAWLRRTNQQATTSSSSSRAAPIGWVDRLEICLGSARGLAFLHHGLIKSSPSSGGHVITHGDVKSSNILLDEHMRPRVSDLGLAKVIRRYETHVKTSVSGALEGYVPPEYPLKMKCDVYSFGVVMLEVLTGRPAAGQEREKGGGNLVGWVRWMVAHGREGGELFDPCLLLPEEEDQDEAAAGVGRRDQQMARVLALAMECTADEPWKRPAMGSVVEELMRIQLMVYNEPHQSPIRGVVET